MVVLEKCDPERIIVSEGDICWIWSSEYFWKQIKQGNVVICQYLFAENILIGADKLSDGLKEIYDEINIHMLIENYSKFIRLDTMKVSMMTIGNINKSIYVLIVFIYISQFKGIPEMTFLDIIERMKPIEPVMIFIERVLRSIEDVILYDRIELIDMKSLYNIKSWLDLNLMKKTESPFKFIKRAALRKTYKKKSSSWKDKTYHRRGKKRRFRKRYRRF